MTATATRPRAAGDPAGQDLTSGTVRSTRVAQFQLPAEFGLIALTVATVCGFARIFVTNGFLVPMVAVGLYAHAVTMTTRRRGFSVPVSALIAIPGLLLLLSWLFFVDTTKLLVPTGDTVSAAQNALQASWDSFQNVVAPAPTLPGFVMASCAALFFAVFLADWAAFRLWSAFEAIVPMSTLFIFCSLLGSTMYRVESTGIFLAAMLGFLLLHRIARQETSAGWLTADITRGSRAALRTGLVLAVASLVLGLLVGQHLPGASSPAMVSWRGADAGPGSRVTISPLVDIQDRLVKQADVEVFTVRANDRAYWRMTSLDTFEGDIWRSGGKYTSVDGDLPGDLPGAVQSQNLRQSFQIENLQVLWLPAAYEPRHIDAGVDVRYQADSSTLIVDTNTANSDSLDYSVQSTTPTYTAEQLRAASASIPKDVADRYLQLPSGFSSKATQVAKDETRGATNPYDKARSLQDYFQANYLYDQNVPKGHGENAIDQFLRDKKGYCEQFAGTYAAMARSLGLPARVAVGFTPGQQDPNDPNLYHVRGEHAHAWPEVYIGQYGWVAFEPTPGRGAPHADAWTGVPEQQDTSGPSTAPSTVTAPPTSATPAPTALENASTTLPTNNAGAKEVETGAPADTGLAGIVLLLVLAAVVLGALVAVIVGYAIAVTSLKTLRRDRRRHQATDPSARVQVAWVESVEELELLGTQYDIAETHSEFAQRTGRELVHSGALLTELAQDVDAAAYAPEILTPEVADRAEFAAGAVITEIRELTPPARQWRRRLDPRPLLPRWRPSRRRRAESTRR